MNELLKMCHSSKRIFIYGAGRNAGHIAKFLNSRQIRFDGYLVTSKNDNPDSIENRRVMSIDEYESAEGDLILDSVLPSTRAYYEVFELLEKRGIKNVYYFSVDEISQFRGQDLYFDKQIIRDRLNDEPYRFEEDRIIEKYHHVFSQNVNGNRLYRWRILIDHLTNMDYATISGFFRRESALSECESVYGKYHPVEEIEKPGKGNGCSAKIYMAAGVKDAWTAFVKTNPYLEPVQVGAALNDVSVFKYRDDIGDNISIRNRNYSEGSVIYWMWKNAPKTDYIGLCHYRRRLVLTEEQIRGLDASKIDVVVTEPTFVPDNNISFLGGITVGTDFRVMREMVYKYCPEYSGALETFYSARFYPPCNLFLMRWDLFKEYGEFAFKICFAVEDHYNELQFRRQDRYMGYLLEALLGIFLIKHKEELNIAYTDMQFIKSE